MASPFKTSLTLPPIDFPDPPAMLSERLCKSDVPLALLPVRLETRFFAQPDGNSELRVRVFPDKVHLDSHEAELTSDEHRWGSHYWELDWRAGNDPARRADAWRQLVGRFGTERAGWVARRLRPTNGARRPRKPVPPDRTLTPKPKFPAVAIPEGADDTSWRRPAIARLLPDRWIAIVHSGGQPRVAAAGRKIDQPLAVGPDPQADEEDFGEGEAPVDAGMRWMVDFEAAEKAGMALRIPIGAALLEAGLDSLFVFGAAGKLSATDTAAALGDLLDAHHHTDGLEFLRIGTPTNNSASGRAGQREAETGASSFAADADSVAEGLAPLSNAAQLGAALGLDGDDTVAILGQVRNGRSEHARDARSMNTALWQVGWGYFLGNMVGLDGTGPGPELVEWARSHFIEYVRGAGPLPPMRFGRQPYGVLPVTSLDLWKPDATGAANAREAQLQALLLKLRDGVWRPRLGEAARVGLGTSDRDAELAQVMTSDAFSAGYASRPVVGRHYFEHLRAFLGEDLRGSGFIAAQDTIASVLPTKLGLPVDTRLARALFGELILPINAPPVQGGEVSPRRGLEPNYIDAILDADIAELLAPAPDAASPKKRRSLLETLLRHAMLRELADATAKMLATQPGGDLAFLLRDAELIGITGGAVQPEGWQGWLKTKVPGVTKKKTIRQFLDGLTRFSGPHLAALGEFRAGLRHLKQLDSETLQWLMQGTLDLSANRLDAWITSLATRRLGRMRSKQPKGVRLGGYGWVENLVPAPADAAKAVEPPAGEKGPMVAPADDSGFIHAPSLTHAAAAALLRNAHLGGSGVPSPESPFAINLSSRRVRDAERLMEGVRMGQPLGALLGYRIERNLHDLALDRFIEPLRKFAPLTASRLDEADAQVEAVAANNVVDGLVLNSKRQSVLDYLNPPDPRSDGIAAPSADELAAIGGELDTLADMIDGLGDALTAELAYQMARGNTARTATTVASIASGEMPPPDLEVARFPRSGTAVTHRMLALFDAEPGVTPGWTGGTARAKAEPVLNAWAGRLLGDPRKIHCIVERLDDKGAVVATRDIRLGKLELAPLDLVHAVAGSDSAQTAQEKFEARLFEQARRSPGAFPADARLRLAVERPADMRDDELMLAEAIEQARAIQQLIAAARSAGPEDLNPPSRTAAGKVDLLELQGRVRTAERAIVTAARKLDALVGRKTPATAAQLHRAMAKLGEFASPAAAPRSGDASTPAGGLRRQAAVVLADARSRIARGNAIAGLPENAEPRVVAARLTERMQAVFGASFVVLPRFKVGTGAAGELRKALAASTDLQGGDPTASASWFLKAARVRDPLARLSTCLHYAEAMTGKERLKLTVGQLPYVAGERWVGLPAAKGKGILPGKMSLVVQSSTALDARKALAGLVVDEWTESVPARRETTAITFQFNPPDSCAPQSLLLAVPSDPRQDWTIGNLHRVLMETLDLAKLRAVDAEALNETSQYLPALYLAFNAKNDVASTDMGPLTL